MEGVVGRTLWQLHWKYVFLSTKFGSFNGPDWTTACSHLPVALRSPMSI